MKELSLNIPNPNLSERTLEIKTPPGAPDLGFVTGVNTIQVVLTIIFSIAGILAVIMIMYSGIQWIMSGGDPKSIEGARNRLVYSIVGLVVIIGSFAIVSLVISMLGGNPSFFL